jgi:hypothetical protein
MRNVVLMSDNCKLQSRRYRWRTSTGRHAHVGTGANLANAERRVWACGTSANHAASRMKFMAAPINRCKSRVLTYPTYRERRRSLMRVPWEMVPSIPAHVRSPHGLASSLE